MQYFRPPSPTGEIKEIPNILNLKELYNSAASNYPDNTAFYSKDTDGYHGITYAETKRDVDALGTAFISLGLKDEKIAVISENRYEWCITYLAACCGTGIIVPLDAALPESEVANLLQRSGAAAVVYSKKLAKTVEKVGSFCPKLKHYINMDATEHTEKSFSLRELIKGGEKLIEKGTTSFINAEIENDKMAILLYTSGTTDFAKGVMLSHTNIVSDVKAVLSSLYCDTNDSIMSILPLHHTYECTCGFLVMFFSGVRITFCPGIKYITKTLQEVQPTLLMLVPLILENMYKKIFTQANKTLSKKYSLKIALFASKLLIDTFNKDIRKQLFKAIHDAIGGNIRLVISGAAALDPNVAHGFENIGVSVRQGYGLTECSPIISVNTLEEYTHDSVGKPMPGIDLKIDNPNDSGVGEIVVRGDNIMLGYYDNEEATNKVLKDGWFYTGDLGYLDKDGFLHITGRQKNVIVTKNGKNIFPEEVESYLNNSPFILESMVIGEETDDGEANVVAKIVLDKNVLDVRFKGQQLTEKEIHDLIDKEVKHVNRQMPLYKRVRSFTIQDEPFEKTTTQKIKRYKSK